MNIKAYIKSGTGKEHKARVSIASEEKGVVLVIHTIPKKHGFPKYLGLEKAEAVKLLKELTDKMP